MRGQGRGLIIYDFDGVIADSEVLANAVLAEIVTELGTPTTLEDSYHRYMGKRFADVVTAVEASVGAPLPKDFGRHIKRARLSASVATSAPSPARVNTFWHFLTRQSASRPHHRPIGSRCAWMCSSCNPNLGQTCTAPLQSRAASRIPTSSSMPPIG